MSDDLVKRLRDMPNYYNSGGRFVAADRIEELDAKLAKAEKILEREIRRVQKIQLDLPPPHKVGLIFVEEEYKLILAELKGQDDE